MIGQDPARSARITRAPRRLSSIVVAICVGLLAPLALGADGEEYARAERYLREGDVVRALPLLRRLADAGYAPAQARLGELMDKAEENAIAAELYRKAAERGDADGAYGLGAMYASGDGVPRDMHEALRWMRVAAEGAQVQAVHFLAQAYLSGEPELKAESDYDANTVRWATRAAETGFVPAMDALAAAYGVGAYGLKPDAALAQTWAQRAEAARQAVASRPASGTQRPR
jgi:TPR repeat protein